LKKELTITLIQPPDGTLLFDLMYCTSKFVVRVVLAQRDGKLPHVIFYVSRTLDTIQANYITTKKELSAVLFALDKFISYTLGYKVIVYTNDFALKFLLKKENSKPGLIRWMLLLQGFDIEIRDRNEAHNFITDLLNGIERDGYDTTIHDNFPDEFLLTLTIVKGMFLEPWFVDIVNYLVAYVIPPSFSKF